MTVMHRFNNHKIWFIAFLLLIFGAGCSDPDKTGTNPGLIPPTVTSEFPPSGAAGVCPNTVVTATFSVAMNPATIISPATTFTLTTGTPAVTVDGAVTYAASSNTATFTPTIALALDTVYTATITTGATDANGIALASNFVWTFTTGSTTCSSGPPTVISVTPPSGANGICPNTVVVATFSDAMNPSTINTTTFTLTAPGTPPVAVAGAVTYDVPSHVATFTPTNPLALSTLYTATITTGAQDLNGNPLASNYVWTFTTSAVTCSAGVPLGSACGFGILGGSTVTNSGTSTFVTWGYWRVARERNHWIYAVKL